jgi:hypothetical protein
MQKSFVIVIKAILYADRKCEETETSRHVVYLI